VDGGIKVQLSEAQGFFTYPVLTRFPQDDTENSIAAKVRNRHGLPDISLINTKPISRPVTADAQNYAMRPEKVRLK